jgi:hypothetical protein
MEKVFKVKIPVPEGIKLETGRNLQHDKKKSISSS